jgi:hypothetical protein
VEGFIQVVLPMEDPVIILVLELVKDPVMIIIQEQEDLLSRDLKIEGYIRELPNQYVLAQQSKQTIGIVC